MAYKYREEIVGKRFLCVVNNSNSINTKSKRNKISEWQWKRGTVRASTHQDFRNTELNVFNSLLFLFLIFFFLSLTHS
jgi:hypothetical protein